jgi:AcrR family transcriptional regulator
MGIQERKEREKEQRKTNIISCAMKVFLAKGIADSTMEEIAECAELSKATLYLYFKNKEEIMLHVMNCVMDNFIEYLEKRIAKAGTTLDKIKMIGAAYLDFYRDCHDLFLLLNSQEFMPGMNYSDQDGYRKYSGLTSKLWTIICAPIYTAMEEGSFRTDTNATELAITLWATTSGLMHIMECVVSPEPERSLKLIKSNDLLEQLQNLNYDKMLRNLWNSIINIYQNQTE